MLINLDKFLCLNSLKTGPNIRVPKGPCCLETKQIELSENFTSEPSFKIQFFLVLITSALQTSPFLTRDEDLFLFLIDRIDTIKNKNKSSSRVKKGDVCKALVIRTKKNCILKDGSDVKFSDNSICLVSKQQGPLGTRILGPVFKEFKHKNLSKFISISSGSV
jgi:ribosomal protein L14